MSAALVVLCGVVLTLAFTGALAVLIRRATRTEMQPTPCHADQAAFSGETAALWGEAATHARSGYAGAVGWVSMCGCGPWRWGV